MNLSAIEELTTDLEIQTDQLKTKLVQALRKLPGNPRITQLGSNPNCFTIQFSDMGTKNWTPFYHNFKMQYEALAEIVEASQIGTLCSKLEDIIRKESYRDSSKTFTYHFHPDVIKHLASMLGVNIEDYKENACNKVGFRVS